MTVESPAPTPASPAPVGRKSSRHQVAIIGSGFGGLWATEELAQAAVDVIMISGTSHHLFQPLLYQVATGVLSEGEVAPATREVLKKQQNATVLLGRVTDIDINAKTVTSVSPLGTTVTPYDSLIVAAGADHAALVCSSRHAARSLAAIYCDLRMAITSSTTRSMPSRSRPRRANLARATFWLRLSASRSSVYGLVAGTPFADR